MAGDSLTILKAANGSLGIIVLTKLRSVTHGAELRSCGSGLSHRLRSQRTSADERAGRRAGRCSPSINQDGTTSDSIQPGAGVNRETERDEGDTAAGERRSWDCVGTGRGPVSISCSYSIESELAPAGRTTTSPPPRAFRQPCCERASLRPSPWACASTPALPASARQRPPARGRWQAAPSTSSASGGTP